MICVIIPVWNGENYLSEAIHSALNQDYEEKEIIVVNDGSTDRTKEIIQSFGVKIRSIDQENKGLGASRNAAIRLSRGEYLAFLDHDDLWHPKKLSTQMKAMQEARNDPLIFSNVQQFICPSLTEEERKKVAVDSTIRPAPLAGTLLISRKRFDQIGPFLEERKQLGEFIEWYLRASEMKIPILMLNEMALYRRVHDDNMGRRELNRRSDYLKILKASLDRRRMASV